MNHKIGLIEEIIMKSARPEPYGKSYREGLRDAQEFLRHWHSLSDDLPQKNELREKFEKVASETKEEK